MPGVSSILVLEAPGPKGLEDPYECLLDPFIPFPPIAFCSNGLAVGENGDPDLLPCIGLPDRGEFE